MQEKRLQNKMDVINRDSLELILEFQFSLICL